MFIGKIVNSLQFHYNLVITYKIWPELFFQFFTLVCNTKYFFPLERDFS